MPGADPQWARLLATPCSDGPGLELLQAPAERLPFLALTPERLELRLPERGMRPLYVDFNDRMVTSRVQTGRRDPLIRALGLHRRPGQTVVDATCGLAQDSATLLGHGCTIHACERSLALLALLRDGVLRARKTPPAADWLARWGGLYPGDAATRLARGEFSAADAVYLDPMFDAPRRHALPGRGMQYLRAIVGPDVDAGHLLAAARAAVPRVVLKRHPRQPPLARPDFSVDSRRVCFDVYLNH